MDKTNNLSNKNGKKLQEYFHQLLKKYDGLCMDNESDVRTLAGVLAHRVSKDLVIGIEVDEDIKRLLREVLVLADRYGAHSNEVRTFILKHQNVGDFKNLAATIMVTLEEE